MKTPIEMLKEEIMERFNLSEDQISFELFINGVTEEKGKEILSAYEQYEGSAYYSNNGEYKGGHTHAKGGFYWVSVREEKAGETIEEFVIE